MLFKYKCQYVLMGKNFLFSAYGTFKFFCLWLQLINFLIHKSNIFHKRNRIQLVKIFFLLLLMKFLFNLLEVTILWLINNSNRNIIQLYIIWIHRQLTILSSANDSLMQHFLNYCRNIIHLDIIWIQVAVFSRTWKCFFKWTF